MRSISSRCLRTVVFVFSGLAATTHAAVADPAPPPSREPAVPPRAAPVELSSGQGRYEMFWTPMSELLLFDNERGQVWIRRGNTWGLMPKVGGADETVVVRPRSTSIVVERAVRALRAAEEQLKRAYGPDHPSVVALREEIDGLSAGPVEERPGSVASVPR